MPSPLPPEMLDIIVDFLHDEPGALKACCLASKSWVHRTRQYLFAHVKFFVKSHTNIWEKTFPDPSNSPARYTRSLTISRPQLVPSVGRDAGSWIRTFSRIVRLQVSVHGCGSGGKASFVPLLGLSPVLKSLHLTYGSSVSYSEIFGLVCSFPLLEDLALVSSGNNSNDDRWSIPSTSPKFTGCLDLRTIRGIRPAVRRLLELPSGLRFSKISVTLADRGVESTMDLVLKCSGTLESLSICYYYIATPSIRQLDLSKLARLKEVVWISGPNVRWITMALQTAESTNLQRITIRFYIPLEASIEELFHREWEDLDCALLQLWNSRSIRLRIEHRGEGAGCELRELAPRLLPELTGRGAVDLVEYILYAIDS